MGIAAFILSLIALGAFVLLYAEMRAVTEKLSELIDNYNNLVRDLYHHDHETEH